MTSSVPPSFLATSAKREGMTGMKIDPETRALLEQLMQQMVQ